MKLQIEVEESFDLEKAICNHGLFMTPPNQWNPHKRSFKRPLRLADGCSSVDVSISSSTTLPSNHSSRLLIIQVHDRNISLSPSDEHFIKKQVMRMLKLTNKDKDDVTRFQEMHSEAKTKGFGRLFRSPDSFEDVMKATLFCRTTWKRTLEMCRNLCELQAEMQKEGGCSSLRQTKLDDFFPSSKTNCDTTLLTREIATPIATTTAADATRSSSISNKAINSSKPLGNFPSSKELAGLSEEILKNRCKLGYRAKHIIQIAKLVEDDKLRLEDLEKSTLTDEFDCKNVRKKLLKLKGIGPFAASSILMCMGDYRNIPTDSETLHHLRQKHGMKDCQKKTLAKDVKQIYDKFAPYQCLAYWYEQIESYEMSLGQKLSKLSPSNYYKVAAGSHLCRSRKSEAEEGECEVTKKRKRIHSRA